MPCASRGVVAGSDSSMSQGTSAIMLSPTEGREGSSRSVNVFLILFLEYVCESQLWSCSNDNWCRSETLISLLKNLKLEPKSRKGFYFFRFFFLFYCPQVTMQYFFPFKEIYPKKVFRWLLGSHKKILSQFMSGKLKYLQLNQIIFSNTQTSHIRTV